MAKVKHMLIIMIIIIFPQVSHSGSSQWGKMIWNQDCWKYSFEVSQVTINIDEGESKFYSIFPSDSLDKEIVISFKTNVNKIQVIPDTLTFSDNSQKQVQVKAIDNNIDEIDNQIIIIHEINGNIETQCGNIEININDNDVAGINIEKSADPLFVSENENGSGESLFISLNSEPIDDVILNFSYDKNQISILDDNEKVYTCITFSKDDYKIKKELVIIAKNDKITEPMIQREIVWNSMSTNDKNYKTMEGKIVVNIEDDDIAQVNFSKNTINLEEGGTKDFFTINLGTQPNDSSVTVTIQESNEFNVNKNFVVFNQNNWYTAVTVEVEAVDDEYYEDKHTCLLEWSILAMSGDYRKKSGSLEVIINDNNKKGIMLTKTNLNLEEENETQDYYEIFLQSKPEHDVLINLTPNIKNKVKIINPTIIFKNDHTWNEHKTITITSIDNLIDESIENDIYQILIYHIANSEDINYNSINIEDITVNIKETDEAKIIVSKDLIRLHEDGQENDNQYQIRLNSQPIEDVVIEISVKEKPLDNKCDSQLIIMPDKLTLTNSNWNQGLTVEVVACDDDVDEGYEGDGETNEAKRNATILHKTTSKDNKYKSLTKEIKADITDNDELPAVSFSINEACGSENVSKVCFPIRLNHLSIFDIEVKCDTSTEDDVYVNKDFSFDNSECKTIIESGTYTGCISVNIIDNNIIENDKKLIMELKPNKYYTLNEDKKFFHYTIKEDDNAKEPVIEVKSPTNEIKPNIRLISGGGTNKYKCKLGIAGEYVSCSDNSEFPFELHEGFNIIFVAEESFNGDFKIANTQVEFDNGTPCSRPIAPNIITHNNLTFTITYEYDDIYSDCQKCYKEVDCNFSQKGSGVEEIKLYVKKPNDADFYYEKSDIGNDIDGKFEYTIENSELIGDYSFKTYAWDKAGNKQDTDDSNVAIVKYRKDFAGYAILAVGSVSGEEGLEDHTYTANMVYKYLINKGFGSGVGYDERFNDADDYIKYLNPYKEMQYGEDQYDESLKGAIQESITEWAQKKISDIRGPLYIVLIGHGTKEKIPLSGTDYISASELNVWLETLENKTENNEIIIVLGTCYSGSFIKKLSKENRIIITSTSENEKSYRGSGFTAGGVRDGELFITRLFDELGKGYDLKTSFKKASNYIEIITTSQHPLLNEYENKSNKLFLGFQQDKISDPVEIIEIGHSCDNYIVDINTKVELWSKVSDPSRLKNVWVNIVEPDENEGQINNQESEQDTVNFKQIELFKNDDKYSNSYTFDKTGKYKLFYYLTYLIDDNNQTIIIDEKKEIINYYENKMFIFVKKSNNPPNIFIPIYPSDSDIIGTNSIYFWDKSYDPDGDQISYYITIEETARNLKYVDAIINNETYVSLNKEWDACIEINDCYVTWKVRAVDEYGNSTESKKTRFYIDNNNNIMGVLLVDLLSEFTEERITDATISAPKISKELKYINKYYRLTYDDVPEEGVQLQLKFENNNYNSFNETIILMPLGEKIYINSFYMTPINSELKGDIYCDNKIDLKDIIIGLQFMIGLKYPDIKFYIDKIKIDEVIYAIKHTISK